MSKCRFIIAAFAILPGLFVGCHSPKNTATPSNESTPVAKSNTASDSATANSEIPPATPRKFQCEEVDRTDDFPWTGVAFEPKTGKLIGPLPKPYVVSIARSWHKPNDAEAFKVLEDHTYRVLGGINKGEIGKGLLGYRFSSSNVCKTALIMAIWESEELMDEFFLSDAHLSAIEASEGNVRYSESTHWTRDNPEPPTFAEAVERLEAPAGK